MAESKASQDQRDVIIPQQVWPQLSGAQQARVLQIISQIFQYLVEQHQQDQQEGNEDEISANG